MTAERTAAYEAAEIILRHGAVYTRSTGDPFFFSSGWASPIFIDVKRLISFPEARSRLLQLSIEKIDTTFGEGRFDLIAGCELAGVPFASAVADRKGLPLVVVLKQGRGFGRLAQFEGTFAPGSRTLLFDDLTTDGRTKVTFRAALEAAEAEVIGSFVLLDYAIFPGAQRLTCLLTLDDIIHVAEDNDHLDRATLAEIKNFARNASAWSRRHGGISTLTS
ncbi:MAG: phosphoribosyltransferase family protein [Pseudomonadota bacterium]